MGLEFLTYRLWVTIFATIQKLINPSDFFMDDFSFFVVAVFF